NLINFAIVPIEFDKPADYDKINQDDQIEIPNLIDAVKNTDTVTIADKTTGVEFTGKLTLSQRDRNILLAGGLLAYTRKTKK
ncbi:MAG: aconitate hydratase, partial [Planctomycetota bacterium]